MGKAPTYEKFLQGLGEVMRENYRVLRPSAFCVWFINDFRRKGTFHLYHADVATLGQAAGFALWDIMVVDLGPGIRDCFINQVIKTRILPKRHEYGVVFRKPEK